MPKRAQRPSLTELLHLLDGALKSFFGVFGWFNIAMKPWMYQLLEFVLVAALLGLARFFCLRFVQRRRAEIERAGLLVLWSAAFIAALVGWTQARWPQGRLLFPAISAICILFVLGLRQSLLLRYARPGILTLLAALVALAALVPYRYIAPAYARARPLTTAGLMAISQPISVEPLVVHPGEKLKVVLRWQALADVREDSTVFVQLIRGRDEIWGQSDHVPRNGQALTSTWKANALVVDEFEVDLSPDAPDGMYQFAMGLYRPTNVKRLELADGTDTVVLGTIAVRSQ